jgi:hypothetical protein
MRIAPESAVRKKNVCGVIRFRGINIRRLIAIQNFVAYATKFCNRSWPLIIVVFFPTLLLSPSSQAPAVLRCNFSAGFRAGVADVLRFADINASSATFVAWSAMRSRLLQATIQFGSG